MRSPVTLTLLVPAGSLTPSAISNSVFSGLNTFTVSIAYYHCTWPLFVPTHQAYCCQHACKARLKARGWRLPGQASRLQDYAALPSRNKWVTLRCSKMLAEY